jgi:hypothetical protein
MNEDLIFLMEENLANVWSQRNASIRLKSIQTIYAENSALFHIGHKTEGFDAINKTVSEVLANTPVDFRFFKLKSVAINNNIGRLCWGLGPTAESIVATGMDIAVFEGEKIKSLYVFLD